MFSFAWDCQVDTIKKLPLGIKYDWGLRGLRSLDMWGPNKGQLQFHYHQKQPLDGVTCTFSEEETEGVPSHHCFSCQ